MRKKEMGNIIYLVLFLTIAATVVYILNINSLKYSYYYLIYLSITSFVVWLFYFNKTTWIKDFSFNLFFLFLGILIVAFMIDRIIARNNLIEKKKYENVALSQLRIPINNHINYLFKLHKATALREPTTKYTSPTDLFNEDFFAQLAFLDFSEKAPVYPSMEYFEYCFRESWVFKESVGNTLEKYAIYLPSDTVELLEEIINSTFISFIFQIRDVHQMDIKDGLKRDYNFLSGNGMINMVHDYSKLIIGIVEKVNMNLDSEKQIVINTKDWSDNIAPKLGSGRIK